MDEAAWYYLRGGERSGPVTSEGLRAAVARGELHPSDLIWKQGLPHWVQACKAKGLFPPQQASPAKRPPPLPDRESSYRSSRAVRVVSWLLVGFLVVAAVGAVFLNRLGLGSLVPGARGKRHHGLLSGRQAVPSAPAKLEEVRRVPEGLAFTRCLFTSADRSIGLFYEVLQKLDVLHRLLDEQPPHMVERINQTAGSLAHTLAGKEVTVLLAFKYPSPTYSYRQDLDVYYAPGRYKVSGNCLLLRSKELRQDFAYGHPGLAFDACTALVMKIAFRERENETLGELHRRREEDLVVMMKVRGVVSSFDTGHDFYIEDAVLLEDITLIAHTHK